MTVAERATLERKAGSRHVRPPNMMKISDAISRYSCAEGLTPKIQILRAFAVYSKNCISRVVALPIGPAYLAGLLETAGYEVDIIDAQGEAMQAMGLSEDGRFQVHGLPVDEIVARIDPASSLLGVSLMFSEEWPHHREVINAIGAAYPDLTIIVGGEHATALSEEVLRTCPDIDYLVSGEGELAFLELAASLTGNGDPRDIGGVSYLDENDVFVANGLSSRISDLDNLPRPAWHLCQVKEYFGGSWTMGIGYGRNMPMLATRGCPYQCTFCSNPFMWTTRYQMRDPKMVVDEIEHLIAEYGANSIDFFDLTAIVKKDWTLAFCEELRRREIDIVWQLPSGTRSEALDEETLRAIYDAGCSLLVYAPESGSAQTLAKIKKRVKLDRMVPSMAAALRIGHIVKINLILGFPHERRRDMLKTVWFALRMGAMGVSDCNINAFSPYPGSELYGKLRDEGKISEPNDAYFEGLLIQADFTMMRSYCENVDGWELRIFRLLGVAGFYSLSYLLHPRRLFGLARSLFGRDVHAANLFEQRILDARARRSVAKRGSKVAAE